MTAMTDGQWPRLVVVLALLLSTMVQLTTAATAETQYCPHGTNVGDVNYPIPGTACEAYECTINSYDTLTCSNRAQETGCTQWEVDLYAGPYPDCCICQTDNS